MPNIISELTAANLNNEKYQVLINGKPVCEAIVLEEEDNSTTGTLCKNVEVTLVNGTISVTILEGEERIVILDSNEDPVLNGDSQVPVDMFVVSGLSAGAYIVAIGKDICGKVEVDGGIDCRDEDQDGICIDRDCDDNDPSVGEPQESGTMCDDGDSETIADVYLSDGCTCRGRERGTLVTECYGAEIIYGNGKIIINLANQISGGIQVFEENFSSEIESNGWNTPSLTVEGLEPGVYDIKINGLECESITLEDTSDCENLTDGGKIGFGNDCKNMITLSQCPANGEQIKIFPNPTTGVVNLNLGSFEGTQTAVKIIDQLGRLVKSYQFGADTPSIVTLKLEDLNTGLYFIQVQNKNTSPVIKRLIISQ